MDVRCAQCQAEYELDDTLVAERGTAVCCSRCGFRFRAYRPAGAVAAPERWTVRTLSGDTLTFLSLRELQEAIVLRRVGPQDALIRGQAPARSIASIVEFRPLFEAAKRGSETLTKARPSMPTPVGLGGPPVGGSSPSLSTPARAVGRPGPEPSGAPAPARTTPGAFGRPAGVLPATPPSASLLVAARPSGASAGHASRPATLAGFEAPSAAIFDQPTVPSFDAGATDTPPAALVVPRGGLRERPSMPSLVQTIPFDQANQGAAREAFEAALRGGGFEGEIVLPGGLGPGPDKNDVTEPLFAGPA
ncbi:MAG TPA: zinc-ribbon domain-containing protein, partial [Polyangiaceae bacterium]|nr:zinc-ribbon domain-containing protein [Polyangiaceae bacterium]